MLSLEFLIGWFIVSVVVGVAMGQLMYRVSRDKKAKRWQAPTYSQRYKRKSQAGASEH
jgi:hypothetical protein